MIDWKACVRTWENRNSKTLAKKTPEWFNKEIQEKEMSGEKQKEIEEFLNSYS